MDNLQGWFVSFSPFDLLFSSLSIILFRSLSAGWLCWFDMSVPSDGLDWDLSPSSGERFDDNTLNVLPRLKSCISASFSSNCSRVLINRLVLFRDSSTPSCGKKIFRTICFSSRYIYIKNSRDYFNYVRVCVMIIWIHLNSSSPLVTKVMVNISIEWHLNVWWFTGLLAGSCTWFNTHSHLDSSAIEL